MKKRFVSIAAGTALTAVAAAGFAAPASANDHGKGGRDLYPSSVACALGVKSAPAGVAKTTLQTALATAHTTFRADTRAAHKATETAVHAAQVVFRTEMRAAGDDQTAKFAARTKFNEALTAARALEEAAFLTAADKRDAAVTEAYTAYFKATAPQSQVDARAACFAAVKAATTTYRSSLEAARAKLKTALSQAQADLAAALKAATTKEQVRAALLAYRTATAPAVKSFHSEVRTARQAYRSAVATAMANLKAALAV